jgi:hypothetical protein
MIFRHQLTGLQEEQLILFKIKDSVDHAGLSQQSLKWKDNILFKAIDF